MNQPRLYSQQQIAEALGITRRAVNKRATNGLRRKNEAAWTIAEREKCRGGEIIRHAYDDLPGDVRKTIDRAEKAADAAVRRREIEAEHTQMTVEAAMKLAADEDETKRREEQARVDRIMEGRKKFNALKKDDDKRVVAQAREWILRMCVEYQHVQGLDKRGAQGKFSMKVTAGDVDLPDFVKASLKQCKGGGINLSEGVIQRWSDYYRESGIWGLVPKWGDDKRGKCVISETPNLFRFIVAAMVRYPHIKPVKIRQYLETSTPEMNVVSVRTIQRFMKRWLAENVQLWTYMTNPDKWKNIYMSAAGSAFANITRLNQLWELDSTPGDWLLKDGRHSVVGAIDLYSRRLKFFVSKTSTAAAVKQLIRRCLLDWGRPEGMRTDNGKDYVSEEIDSLLRDLQIMHEVCIPFASEEKGTIERAMRTMSHGILDLLPGFIGHSVADRKQIEARKAFSERVMNRDEVVEVALTSDELQTKLDEWTDYVYSRNPHAGLNGKTPWEVANAWRDPILRISDEHALDELLAGIGGARQIGKKGIRYDNRFFIDPAGVMHEHVGREVAIRLDEHDIGRIAVYLDGAFLCWAQDPDAAGIERREAAAAIKHHVKKKVAEQASELKKFAREMKTDIVQTVIDHRRAMSENIVELPKRAEDYTTPALDAARDAAMAKNSPSEQPRQQAEVIDHAAFREEFEGHNERVQRTEDNRRTHANFLRLEERISAGFLVTQQDRRAFEIYKQGGMYESMQQFFESFGLTADDFK